MGHLGDFGTDRPPQHDAATFGYFGSVLRVHPDLSELAFIELLGQIEDGDKSPATAVSAFRAIGSTLIHPDDVENFWRLARANRQKLEDLVGLAAKLLEALTDRPTERPSDSSAGPPPTGAMSADGSSSPALRLLENRPDLAVAVLRAQEAASA